jgi:hypothetical protein
MAQRGTPGHPPSRPVGSAASPEAAPASDWPVQAADTIERVVGSVRDKTTGPAISVARGVVYGTLAAIVGISVLVLLAIAAVRGLDIAAREIFGDGSTWLAHLVVGVLFCLGGMIAWSQRSKGAAT